MDFIIYIAVLLIVGFIKVSRTADVAEDVGLTAATNMVQECDLPVGENYRLKREEGAFTLILMELGLI